MAKQKTNLWSVFGLQFVGSLIYLFVVFTTSGAYMNSAWNGSAALWQPVLYATAVIGAIALFFTSFANFGGLGKSAAHSAKTASVLTGFALAALTFGSSSYFLVSLIGFVLSYIGAGWAKQ